MSAAAPPPGGGHQPLRYMRQLDGLRAVAIVLVLLHHAAVSERYQLGFLGVRLFFVLSGFLITAGLVATRRDIDAGTETCGGGVRKFYLRRSLRIFPIYYALVAALIAVNLRDVRPRAAWLLSYTTNYDIVLHGWYVAPVNHLWSLAVEEQFYLVWPWLILFLPRAVLGPVCLLAAAAGLVYRCAVVGLYGGGFAATMTTLACVDGFAVGAWFALRRAAVPARFGAAGRWFAAVGFALMAGWAAFSVADAQLDRPWYEALGDSATAVFFGGIVALAADGLRGPAGWLLERPSLVYLGKISYGVYLYHMVLLRPWTTRGLARGAYELCPADCAVSVLLTVLVASASWYLIERPINRWKDRFR